MLTDVTGMAHTSYKYINLKMNTKLIVLVLFAVVSTTVNRFSRRIGLRRIGRTTKMEVLKKNFCNFQACEKCEIEVRRHYNISRMGRMCNIILQIQDCCEIHSITHNSLGSAMGWN